MAQDSSLNKVSTISPSPDQPPALPWEAATEFVWTGAEYISEADGEETGQSVVMFFFDKSQPERVEHACQLLQEEKDWVKLLGLLEREKLDDLLVNAVSADNKDKIFPAYQRWGRFDAQDDWVCCHRRYLFRGVPTSGPVNPATGAREESEVLSLVTGERLDVTWRTSDGKKIISADFGVIPSGSLNETIFSLEIGQGSQSLPEHSPDVRIDFTMMKGAYKKDENADKKTGDSQGFQLERISDEVDSSVAHQWSRISAIVDNKEVEISTVEQGKIWKNLEQSALMECLPNASTVVGLLMDTKHPEGEQMNIKTALNITSADITGQKELPASLQRALLTYKNVD